MDQPTELERELTELRQRCAAQEQVQRDYLAQIKALQDQLQKLATKAERERKAAVRALEEEYEIYRILIKGWPKGRRLVKRLTRDPYDD